MAQSTKQVHNAAPTTAAQQGDNIAHALAGAGGGLLSMTLTCVFPFSNPRQPDPSDYSYPLITLSTRAQVESKRAQTSTLEAVRHIVRREGFGGLYSGLESALFGISVTNFVYYYCKSSPIMSPNFSGENHSDTRAGRRVRMDARFLRARRRQSRPRQSEAHHDRIDNRRRPRR